MGAATMTRESSPLFVWITLALLVLGAIAYGGATLVIEHMM